VITEVDKFKEAYTEKKMSATCDRQYFSLKAFSNFRVL
jgi:hypothetical protein